MAEIRYAADQLPHVDGLGMILLWLEVQGKKQYAHFERMHAESA